MAVDLMQVAQVATEPGELPETMAAWVIRQEREGEPIDAFQVEEIEVPEPGAFEVVVRVMAAGSSFGMQAGAFVGPMLGGLLLAGPGPAWAYGVDVAGLVVATGLFAALHRYAPSPDGEAPSIAGIVAGIRYAVGRRDLLGTYVVDMVAMFLALPVVLFPALASDVFDRPELLGVLYTAETLGALLAGLTSGWIGHVNRHGKAIVIAAMCWGGAVALAGLSPTIWVAAVFLAIGGAADSISAIFRGTVWHQTIPDSMRGRMAGIEMLSYSLGPLGGQVRSGFVADRTSVRASIVSGGVLCVVGVGATAAWLRGFWTYDARTDEYARAERERRAQAGTD